MIKRFRNWLLGVFAAFAALFGWQYASASVTLSWTPPTENTDGSPLTDLDSYRIYRRGSETAGTYTLIATVPAPAGGYQDNSTLEGLNCYVVSAVDARGNESDVSNQACMDVDTLFPRAPTGLTAN